MNYSQAQTSGAPGKAIFINYPPIRVAWQARPDANVGNLNFSGQFVNMLLPLFRSGGHGPVALEWWAALSPASLLWLWPGRRWYRAARPQGCSRGSEWR